MRNRRSRSRAWCWDQSNRFAHTCALYDAFRRARETTTMRESTDGTPRCKRESTARARVEVRSTPRARCQHQTCVSRGVDTYSIGTYTTHTSYFEIKVTICVYPTRLDVVGAHPRRRRHTPARDARLGRIAHRASHRRRRVFCVRARGHAARDGEGRAFRARVVNCLSTARAEVRVESWRQTCRARRA